MGTRYIALLSYNFVGAATFAPMSDQVRRRPIYLARIDNSTRPHRGVTLLTEYFKHILTPE